MGVKTCNRPNCGAIMCDRYSVKHGYICSTCFDELVSYGVGINVERFMDLKPKPINKAEEAYQYFQKEFPIDS